MKRVLILSPHFPPINAPDAVRVRLMLPYLHENGWQAEVLAVDPRDVAAPVDERLATLVPPDIAVHRVRAFSLTISRLLGMRTLGRRAAGPIKRAGHALLLSKAFDLVFASTTQFATLDAALDWKRRHRLPLVVDFQDPLVTNYYNQPGAPEPPGGRVKYGIARAKAVRRERAVIDATDAIVSVSAGYPELFARRYPGFPGGKPVLVQPFGFDPRDYDAVSDLPASSRATRRRIVFVGSVGGIMQHALGILFAGLRRRFDAGRRPELVLEFIGTSYAPPGREQPSVLPLARTFGLESIVSEAPARIPYLDSLAAMRGADWVLIMGSTDPSYQPSKLLGCLASGRPSLALLHRDSAAAALFARAGGGVLVPFVPDEDAAPAMDAALDRLVATPPMAPHQVDLSVLEDHTARAMTQRLCQLFAQSMEPRP
jgi:glycosyltransferase involved in cell wall biosynthesis